MSHFSPSANPHTIVSRDYEAGEPLLESEAMRKKNLVFAIILTCIQIAFCFLYGFLFVTPPSLINVSSIITAIGLAILVIIGFGLVFGYTRRLVWSGIGFNFFIFAFCLELYPLVNDFWTKTGLQSQNSPMLDFTYSNRFYNLYLSNRQTSPAQSLTYYGNCITNAMKCALAVVIAFSSILGRAGQLECLFVSITGVIGFELNRQVLQERVGSDAFGTFYIFTFGGFMGLILGLFLYLRQKNPTVKFDEISLRRYTASEQSVLFSFLGALFIFVCFPFLAFQIDSYIYQSNFASYSMPFCNILAMGAGVIGGAIASLMFNGYLIARDPIHGLIAGAIVAGTASHYILNPTYALIAGGIGGLLQGFIQNIIERSGINNKNIISTVSWSLFGFQGILGGCFAAAWKQVAFNNWQSTFANGLVLKNFGASYEVYAALLSAGIGMGFGLIAGIIIYLTTFQYSNEFFEDGYYWRSSDCIRTLRPGERRPLAPQPPVATDDLAESDKGHIYCEEKDEDSVNNRHAYL